ncbi:uncharacterized protein [Leptinotarsa decemlineata]|uniref:uncharacterized protein n=1 Tax=Leptinotarsa decemlineata TaxID=7539 RepID=UPI000C253B9D|nr:uncharacterized protein LOC111502734 [Leptinotarsa decemlineata]
MGNCFKPANNSENNGKGTNRRAKNTVENRQETVHYGVVHLDVTATRELSGSDDRKSKSIPANVQTSSVQREWQLNRYNSADYKTQKEIADKNKLNESIEKQKAIQIQKQHFNQQNKQKEIADAKKWKEIVGDQNALGIKKQNFNQPIRQFRGNLCHQLNNLTLKPPEKIIKNPEMIDNLLFITNKSSYYSHVTYQLENLDQFSSDYQRVERLFRATNKRCFTVQKIETINNPYLLLQYSLKKLQYLAKYGRNVEHELFHGTRKSNIESICNNNFNWRLRGTAKGHKFGQGISLTPISNYATHYGDDGYNKVMFLVKVLIGNKCLGAQHMNIPPKHYDTTTNEKEHVIVKYEDNEFYPAYLIYYGGVDMNKNNQRGGRRGYNRRY